MAEPLRKPPAGRESETAPREDPFRYGWRWRSRRLPNGKVVEEQIPLTAEDLLDPQLGDEVPQSDPHVGEFLDLGDTLRRRYASREDVFVACDLKMLWGLPGVPEPSPDLAVIPGVRKKEDPKRTSFDVVEEGARPCLILEIVSSTDEKTRRNDYEKKVDIYQKVGIPEYLILDPPTPATRGRLVLTGYRLGPDGRYQRIEPDREGRLLSETTDLLFGVADDGRTLRMVDAVTGEPLLTSRELELQVTREAAARQKAERLAAREAAARQAEAKARREAEQLAAREASARREAEAELARLRAELERREKP
jgi:Uma2 family endonuclease